MQLSQETKDFIEDRVSRFPRYFERIDRVKVTTITEGDTVEVEIIVHPPGGTIVAKDRGDDLHVVVDRSADKIERSLKRLKDKLSERRARREEAVPADEGAEEEEQSYEDILRVLLEEDES